MATRFLGSDSTCLLRDCTYWFNTKQEQRGETIIMYMNIRMTTGNRQPSFIGTENHETLIQKGATDCPTATAQYKTSVA
jgi:hypothetical protein